jgi:hypothetical protein
MRVSAVPSGATAPVAISPATIVVYGSVRAMMIASTLSTVEAVIPYVILASVAVFIALRLVVGPLVDLLRRARKGKRED